MSSPPLPSTPFADRFAWLAGEVRAEKDDAGMIVALFIELFARLLGRLAGIAARIEAGTLPRPEPRDIPALDAAACAAAPVAPGLLPRVFGWLGGLLPTGGPVARARHSPNVGVGVRGLPCILPLREGLSPFSQPIRSVSCGQSSPSVVYAEPLPRPLPQWEGRRRGAANDACVPWALPVAWRRLPASTAGPSVQHGDFRSSPAMPTLLRLRNVL